MKIKTLVDEELVLKRSQKLAIAVCVQVKVKANSKENIEFSLVWHMPSFFFNGDKSKMYNRYYTKHFPAENENCALDIASYSLSKRSDWIKAIREWQRPIFSNK